jgi:hypothetical protein
MNFDISSACEILSATPSTLRALLGNLSEPWTGSNTDLGIGNAELGAFETDPSRQIQNPKPKIQNRKWVPFDVVGHLIHGEETDWIPRARIILAQGEERTFVPFDRFAQFEKSKGRSMTQLLDEFGRLRAENLDILRSWNLSEEQLDLRGVHPELGPVTLRHLLATWVVHDLNHIRQIVVEMAHRYDSEVGPWREYLSILEQ